MESLAYVDPLFTLDAEPGVLVQLNAVLVEEKWKSDNLGLIFAFVLTEGTDKRLVRFLAEGAYLLSWLHGQRIWALDKIVIFVRLGAWRVWLRHYPLTGLLLLLRVIVRTALQHFKVVG